MANTIYDLDIYRGISFTAVVSATNSDGSTINLSGYSFDGCIREYFGATGSLVDFTITPSSPLASGVFSISLSNAETSGLPVGQFVYDVKGLVSGAVDQFLQGYANIYPAACLD